MDEAGLFIPVSILFNNELSPLDKMIASALKKSEVNGTVCENAVLAKICGCTGRSATKAIAKLIELGLCESFGFDGRIRHIRCKF